jgi:hypothetical protein
VRVVLAVVLAAALGTVLLGGAVPSSAQPVAIEVTILNDVVLADDECSLREAIANVNDGAQTYADCAAPGAETTIVLPAGTIVLAAELLITAGPVTIEGQGIATSIIDADEASRHFRIEAPEAVTLRDLRLTEGNVADEGGAIYHIGGDLTLERVQIDRSNADNMGGAAFIRPPTAVTIAIIDSVISSNTADGTAGILFDGELDSGSVVTVSGSQFSFNEGWAGAISGRAFALEVSQSTFNNNTAGFAAGIGVTDADVTIDDTVFRNNAAANDGGAIRIYGGTLTITRSLFDGNEAGASGSGGAISSEGGFVATTIVIDHSLFEGNSAGDGGAVAVSGGGAGVQLLVTRSTFVDNSGAAGAAVLIGGGAVAAIENSTFDSNPTTYSVLHVEGAGSEADLVHLTVAGAAMDGIVMASSALLIVEAPAQVRLHNSVLVQWLAACGGAGDIDGTGNAADDGTCPGALLASVEDLGPLTEDPFTGIPTRLPLRRTALIDSADATFCLDDDQLAWPRPVGLGCDIGAREHRAPYQAFAPMIARDP